MPRTISIALLLTLIGCSSQERRTDGVTPSEARALDNAAAKLDDAQSPRTAGDNAR